MITTKIPLLHLLQQKAIQKKFHMAGNPGWWSFSLFVWLTGLLTGLDSTIATIDLPTIIHDLNIGDNYILIINF